MALKIEIKFYGQGEPLVTSEIIQDKAWGCFETTNEAMTPKRISREELDYLGRLEEKLNDAVMEFHKENKERLNKNS